MLSMVWCWYLVSVHGRSKVGFKGSSTLIQNMFSLQPMVDSLMFPKPGKGQKHTKLSSLEKYIGEAKASKLVAYIPEEFSLLSSLYIFIPETKNSLHINQNLISFP
jgi:hypothetical protein